MSDFKIKLKSTLDTEPSYAGYRLVATYRQKILGDYVSGKQEVEINAEGMGILTLPPRDMVEDGNIFIDIFAYNGFSVFVRETFNVDFFYETTSEEIEFIVKPVDQINLGELKTAYKISGKLIDLEKDCNLNELTLAIYGGKKGESVNKNEYKIIATSESVKDGYYSFILPYSEDYDDYYMVVGGYLTQPISLANDSKKIGSKTFDIVADKQILSFTLETNKEEVPIKECGSKDKKKSNCGCSDSNSQEMGGQCVNFTIPNRTIDEFSFYQVVRTTEPDIKSVTINPTELLKVYESVNFDLAKLASEIQTNPLILSVPQMKEKEMVREQSKQAGSRTARSTVVTNEFVTETKTQNILRPLAVNKITFEELKVNDLTTFNSNYSLASVQIVAEFNKRNNSLRLEENNILTLISEISEDTDYLRLNLDQPDAIVLLNDLIYKIEMVQKAIKKYVENCQALKVFYADNLNQLMVSNIPSGYSVILNNKVGSFQSISTKLTATLSQLVRLYSSKNQGRKPVSSSNEIDWDNVPTVYHNTTIAHGHLIHIKHICKNDGYSIGRVLNSIPLMPGQQKNIAVMEWNRTNIGSRMEDQTTEESLSNNMSRDRDVSEVMNSAFSESIRASSQVKSKTSGWSVGASVGFPIGPVMAGVSGGYSSSKSSTNSSASQDSSRNLSANTMNKLRDNINQSATSLRSQRSTVVQTVSQNESFSISTEVIANYNHCHAVTMQYFEILRHIIIEQKIVDVQECLFVPLPMTPFDIPKVIRWMQTLSGILLQPQLSEGLKAIDRINSDYDDIELPMGQYADEKVEYIEGELYLSFSFTRPIDELNDEGKERLDALKTVFDSHGFWALGGARHVLHNLYHQLEFKLQRERDAVFEHEVVPKIIDDLVQKLKISINGTPLNCDFTLVDSYENKRIGSRESLFSYVKNGRSGEISKKNQSIKVGFKSIDKINEIRRNIDQLTIGFEAISIENLPEGNKITLNKFKADYNSKYYSGNLVASYNVNDDIQPKTGDVATVRTPLHADEKRNPRKEDKILSNKLINHLNEYLEYYHKQLWLSMDPNRLFSLVDGFIAPNSDGRSIASVCDNQIVGVVGNNLVLKVAPGYKLDPSYKIEDGDSLLEHYTPPIPPDPFRICFPTNGVYAESVMGACNSCEKIDDTRYWKWEEHPIPNKPTEIQPISTDSRYVDLGNLQTKDLATPMINIQNAPDAPAPTGLGGVLDLMGKSGIFKDMTGLEGNQDIVKEALKVNAEQLKNTQANAVKGMEIAKQIYDSQQANKDVQRKVEEIDKAFPPDGTDEQKAENDRLKSALFEKQIGIDGNTSPSIDDKVNKIKTYLGENTKESNDMILNLLKKELLGEGKPIKEEDSDELSESDIKNYINQIGYNYFFK